MGISTFYSYRDYAKPIDTVQCKSEVDYIGNIEVTLADDTKNNLIRLKNNKNNISKADKATRILKYLESIQNKDDDNYSRTEDTKEKTNIEKWYDTQLSMKQFDIFLEQGYTDTTLASSDKYRGNNLNLAESMRYARKNVNPPVAENPHEVKISVIDLSKDKTKQEIKNSSKQKLSPRVTFHTDVVTRIVFFQPISIKVKKNLFYTSTEMQQFRMDYMLELQSMDEYAHLDAKGLEVWDAIQYCGETVFRFLFPVPK